VTSWQLLIWGFFISTTALFHGTSCINSLAHLLGGRRFSTTDDSRNSFLLAIITLGEGWHNNHHRYMSSTRQGFYWWEIDITYYLLRILSWTGFIHSLKEVPASIYAEADAQAHAHSVKTSASSSHGSEIASLRRVVPAAAAIALATVPATTTAPHKPSVSEVPPTGLNTTPPADNA
jgi:stearoyl-CoA desaturase (delta-9 desaturase)